jgi:phosphatidylinositol glycan class B
MRKYPYRYLFFLGFVVHVIAAFYSEGFHHPDEHFQILEFTNYKLGNSPVSELPWEYEAQTRATLQPFLSLLVIRLINFLGILNPFFYALVLRLLTGILAWYMTCKISLLLLDHFSTEKGKEIFILLGQTLWFVPYINVRYSSENLAGITLLIAVYLILLSAERQPASKVRFLVLAGLILGLSFFFRFQIALSIIGIGLWLILIYRISWNHLVAFTLSGTFSMVMSILIDSWFYGETVLTPMIYFDIQILQDKIANAGVSPWWKYITDFLIRGVPLVSIPVILFLALGFYKKPTSIFVYILVPFLVVHMMISHKEIRFMFPMLFSSIYLASAGLDYLITRYPIKTSCKYAYSVFYTTNVCALVIAIFIPAQEAVGYYRYIYQPLQEKRVTVLSIQENPYQLVGYKANFYKPPDSDIKVFTNYEKVKQFLYRTETDSVLVLSRDPVLEYDFGDFKKERVYTLFPDWMLDYDVFNWPSRARTWSIYKVYKE